MSPEPRSEEAPAHRIRLVIADDHGVVLKGLHQLFLEEHDFEVVAACADGTSALEAVRTHRPDVLVLDLRMPTSGLDVMRDLVNAGDTTRVVVLTGNLDEREMIEAMRLGVRGVVLKEMAPKLLIQCIRKVHAGGKWLENDSVSRAMDMMIRKEVALRQLQETLTAREFEVLRLVGAGLSNVQIADRLCVSEGTVKTHVHSIYEKLDIRGRVQLTLFARENGLA